STAGQTKFWISGPGSQTVQPISGQLITVTNGVPAKIAVADKLGGPSTGALALASITGSNGKSFVFTADDSSKNFYAAVVDAGGNYLSDIASPTWSSGTTNIQNYLTANGNGTVTFTPTKSTTAPATGTLTVAKTGLGSDA